MKEVRLIAWCDVPTHAGQMPSVRTVRISLDGGPMLELDLCGTHMGQYVEKLEKLLADRGVEVDVPRTRGPGKPKVEEQFADLTLSQRHTQPPLPPADAPAAEVFRCPVCQRTYRNGEALKQHLGRVEGATVTMPDVCPDCGLTFDMPNLMGSHRKQAHGFNGLEDALAQVKAMGKVA